MICCIWLEILRFPFVNGSILQFHIGYRDDSDSGICVFGNRARSSINTGWIRPMSVHLFILYWGMLSFITPPVALGAFAAASIAGSSALATGFKAMRFGSVIYFIPFFFVLEPALILRELGGKLFLLLPR
ncbi:MAG: hypothetical protein Ct9H90mP25_2040 [Gammaproteobacteria bacterium]|nr:MAG: hypothetical protein Ct9H90mP25_2040 [Gammaproteobacteria bacterium]